ncbi:hypothetical protein I7I51_07767 [Histoplasma capsulatum]|uniref:Uncharacterized protein n=1 Tax=Ajellomyces capsulatus TaxID=5037 RepID=A0A8A1M0M7_AJECA|nr:hypothetical protein I7I51_07767 [Histoplasma capsulatum]
MNVVSLILGDLLSLPLSLILVPLSPSMCIKVPQNCHSVRDYMHPSKECEEFLNCSGFQICMRDYQIDDDALSFHPFTVIFTGSIVIGLKILFISEKLSSLKKYRVVRQKLTISARTARGAGFYYPCLCAGSSTHNRPGLAKWGMKTKSEGGRSVEESQITIQNYVNPNVAENVFEDM